MFCRLGFVDERRPGGRHRLVERRMDPSRAAVDQLRQRLDIGRQEFLHPAVFEDQVDDPVFVRKRLKVLLVGTELFGFRHLGLLGNAHLRKKHLAQLPCRVDVQIRLPGLGPHRSLQFRQLAVQLHGIGGQRLRVDPHTCHLDVGQHGDHRRLDLEIEVLQSDLLDQREEHPLEPERDVGILPRRTPSRARRSPGPSSAAWHPCRSASRSRSAGSSGTFRPGCSCCGAIRDPAGSGGSSYRRSGPGPQRPTAAAPSGRT